jgi:hypothetical protein
MLMTLSGVRVRPPVHAIWKNTMSAIEREDHAELAGVSAERSP